MRDNLTILTAGLVLALALAAPAAAANPSAGIRSGLSRTLARTQSPVAPETCRPKWPYIVLTCAA